MVNLCHMFSCIYPNEAIPPNRFDIAVKMFTTLTQEGIMYEEYCQLCYYFLKKGDYKHLVMTMLSGTLCVVLINLTV